MTQGAAGLPQGQPMSLAEWADLDEDEPGELVDGQLVEEEEPDYPHEMIVAWLGRVVGNWLEPLGGYMGGSGAKFAVSSSRGRKPDVTVFLPGGRKPPRRGLVRVPPEIAVEIVSPRPRDGRRDRVEKFKEYAAFGVRWYWLIDPGLQELEIHELGADGRYTRALSETGGVIQSVPGCEGLVLDLDALWAKIATLEPEASGESEWPRAGG